MSYTVFARKYRPRTFEDVLGQDHVVRTLKNAIAQNRLAHAYLFVGPRGTGKTSTARIFAKALNCTDGPRIDFDPNEDVCVEIAEGRSLDVQEIDGASNNGVEDVRKLRESVGYAPARGKFRIYYIDEVHMLSTAAFNALLKTLEEPPEHVKFIFATTEAHKILPTIISRCQRFDLRRIPSNIIADHLLHIAKLEGLKLDRLAAHAIARGADGGMRDAQSMLDQLVAFCGNEVREEDVMHIFGFTSYETVAGLADDILRGRTAQALGKIHAQSEAGKDLSKLLSDVIGHFRNVLVHQVDPAVAMKELPPEMAALMAEQSTAQSGERLMNLLDILAETDAQMRWAPNKRICFEIGIIKAAQTLSEATISDVITVLAGMTPTPTAAVAAANSVSAAAPLAADAAPFVAVPAVGEPPPQPSSAPPVETEEVGKLAEAESIPAADASGGIEASAPEAPRQLLTDGAEIWAATLQIIDTRLPLTASWAHQGQFCEFKGAKLVVGFAPEHEMACESLERKSTSREIELILAEVSGKALKFCPEVRAELAQPVESEQQMQEAAASGSGEPAPEEDAAGAPADKAPARTEALAENPAPKPAASSGKKSAGSGNGKPAPAEAADEAALREAAFRNDSFIRSAVEIFKAKEMVKAQARGQTGAKS